MKLLIAFIFVLGVFLQILVLRPEVWSFSFSGYVSAGMAAVCFLYAGYLARTSGVEKDTAARDRAEELLAKYCIGEEVPRADLIRWWVCEDDAVWSWIERSVSPSPAILGIYEIGLRRVRIA